MGFIFFSIISRSILYPSLKRQCRFYADVCIISLINLYFHLKSEMWYHYEWYKYATIESIYLIVIFYHERVSRTWTLKMTESAFLSQDQINYLSFLCINLLPTAFDFFLFLFCFILHQNKSCASQVRWVINVKVTLLHLRTRKSRIFCSFIWLHEIGWNKKFSETNENKKH